MVMRTALLETRKRDGSWVGTPVSIARQGKRLYFRSYDASGKAKRLRNFAEIRLTPSTLRGKPRGETVLGRARLLGGDDAGLAQAALHSQFPVLHGRLVPALHRRRGWTTLYYEIELET
jgi:PPOX class probable F420-dependent enzyme